MLPQPFRMLPEEEQLGNFVVSLVEIKFVLVPGRNHI
jgi:hypothetical protein